MPSKQTNNNDVIAIEELVNEIKQNLRFAPSTTGAATSHPLQQPTIINSNNNNSNGNELFLQQSKHCFSHHHHPQQQQQQLIIRKQRSRPSPYHIPCRSWSETSTAGQKQKNLHHQKTTCNNDENALEDPYELLQSLLKNNSLVKEAVRRLQLNTSTYSRKQNYFYDSDEDNRSPMTMMMMCQLES